MPAAPIPVDDLEREPDDDGDKEYVGGFESHGRHLLSMEDAGRNGKF